MIKFGSEDGRNVHASSFHLRNHAGKRSLRVAIAVIILFAVVFILFIFTLVRLLPRNRHVANDQKDLSRSSLNACPMVRGTRE